MAAFDGGDLLGDTVTVALTGGARTDAEPLITGEVNLFRQSYRKSKWDLSDLEIMKPEIYGIGHRYFIGVDHMEEITRRNYRKLVRKYLKDAPELHRSLGRLGFRYENIPSMILYYNRLKSDQPVTVEQDLEMIPAFLMD